MPHGEFDLVLTIYGYAEYAVPGGGSVFRTVVADVLYTDTIEEWEQALSDAAGALTEEQGGGYNWELVGVELTPPTLFQYFRE